MARKKILNLDAQDIMYILPFISVMPIFIGKVIPDVWAFYIALIAIGESWERKISLKTIIFLSLSLMIKPNIAPIYFLFLFEGNKSLRRYLVLSIPVLIGFIYIYFVNKLIARVNDLGLYAVHFKGLGENLKEALNVIHKYPKYISGLFITKFAILIYFFDGRLKEKLPLISTFLLIIIFYVTLCGTHTIMHEYYVLPLVLLSALLFFKLKRKLIIVMIISIILMRNIEIIYNESKNIFTKNYEISLSKECLQLKDKMRELNQEIVTTKYEYYPKIGICAQVFTNSNTSDYAIYENKDTPENSKIIAKYGKYNLVKMK